MTMKHVGEKHYDTYFKLVDLALKFRDATVVVTSSAFPESRFSGYQCVFFLNTFFRVFSIVAAERKTSCTNTCGRTPAYQVRRR